MQSRFFVQVCVLGAITAALWSCQGNTSPTQVPAGSSDLPSARDRDSLCQSVRSLDSADHALTSAGTSALHGCLERFVGSWTLDSTSLPDLEAALDTAVAGYSDQWKASVRERLRQVARFPARVDVRLPWPEMAFDFDGDSAVRSRPDGVPAPFEDEGEEIWLATTVDSGRVVQVFQASDGARRDVYAISKDGKNLSLLESTTGDGMLRPLVIALRYRLR